MRPNDTLDDLLHDLYEVSQKLYTAVVVNRLPLEHWEADIDDRQQLIDAMKLLTSEGQCFTEEHKQQKLREIMLLDEQITTAMEHQLNKIQEDKKLAKVKHNAGTSYARLNRSFEYGAFFDKRK